MLTIICMSMIMYTAETEIQNMRQYNTCDCGNQQPGFDLNEEEFENKQDNADSK